MLLLLLMLGAPLGYLFELLLPLAVCAIGVSFLLSVYLYVRSFWAAHHALALGGNTGENRVSSIKKETIQHPLVMCCASVGWFCCLVEDCGISSWQKLR